MCQGGSLGAFGTKIAYGSSKSIGNNGGPGAGARAEGNPNLAVAFKNSEVQGDMHLSGCVGRSTGKATDCTCGATPRGASVARGGR